MRRVGLIKIVDDRAMDFTSSVLADGLGELLPEVQQGDWHTNRLVLPFILTCSVALEARLNDHLVAFCFDEFGKDNYKRVADSYLGMNFRGKLDSLISILTKNRFVVNKDSPVYRHLCELILLRNELVHAKSFFTKIPPLKNGEQLSSELLGAIMDKKRLRLATHESCINFYESLTALDTLFFFPLERGDLCPNALVVLNEVAVT